MRTVNHVLLCRPPNEYFRQQIIVLDVVPPEKMPTRVVPRIGVRDRAAAPAAAQTSGSRKAIGTDAATSSSRKGHGGGGGGGTVDSAQALGGDGGGDTKCSSEGVQEERDRKGVGGGGGGRNGGEGTKGEGVKMGGRVGRAARRGGGGARRRGDGSPERFFEVSATSQVKMGSLRMLATHTHIYIYVHAAILDGRCRTIRLIVVDDGGGKK